MIDDLIASLNPMQRRAVELGPVHALVLAGAGSGKTKVLTTRIAWLLSQSIAYPSQILAVTFTNKAAREMRTRLEAMVPTDLSLLWMGTFHGLAHRILRSHWAEANLDRDFQIIDNSDQIALIRRIMKDAGIDPKMKDPRSFRTMINSFKERGLRAADVRVNEDGQEACSFYRAYEGRCQREGLCDFAELMLRCVELLERNQTIREHYAQRFRFILVDEFQDTNALQFRWIRALCAPGSQTGCVFCVGDDDQSIYAFRGALVGNMADFIRMYEVKDLIKLEQNYRSTSHILDASNAVIANNSERMGKNLWTDSGAGEKITIYGAVDDRDEAKKVTQEVMLLKSRGEKYRDCAVLYRNNAQSRMFEQYFNANHIPYRIHGGLRFFDRQEIKDATAYLRMLYAADDTSLLRVINTPPRGIGATTIERAEEAAKASGKTIWETIRSQDNAQLARTKPFIETINRLKGGAKGKTLYELVEYVIDATGLKLYYESQKDSEIRVENLGELLSAAAGYYEENRINEDALALDIVPGGEMSPLAGFLSQAVLEADDKNQPETADAVQMMTVHAAKGLEFNNVFLSGLEDRLFPHASADDDAKVLSEERRLMYVAMTRAKKRLHISWAGMRTQWGQVNYQQPSRFLDEIPEEHTIQKMADDESQVRMRRGCMNYGSYDRTDFDNGYGSGYARRSSFGRSTYYSGTSVYHKPPTGKAAESLDSDAWKKAGLKRASDLLAAKKRVEAGGFATGDTVRHCTLGTGVIERILYPEKLEETILCVKFGKGPVKELKFAFVADKLEKL